MLKDVVVDSSMSEDEFNSLIIEFLKKVLTENSNKNRYDIKPENTLYFNREINLIDCFDSSSCTIRYIFQNQRNLMTEAYKKKSKFKSVIEGNQKEFLWANIVLTISELFRLRKCFQNFENFINVYILALNDPLDLVNIIGEKELDNFRKFVNSNLHELYEENTKCIVWPPV